jgi:AcrR family transcriptional regulator
MAEVFDAAAAVFAEKGYHGTSTKDKADGPAAAGSLYYYFASGRGTAQGCEAGVAGFVESLRQIVAGNRRRRRNSRPRSRTMRPLATRPAYARVPVGARPPVGPASPRDRQLTREYEQLLAGINAEACGRARSAPTSTRGWWRWASSACVTGRRCGTARSDRRRRRLDMSSQPHAARIQKR